MEINQITKKIIGCAIEVHKNLGPGLLESVYRECMAYEFAKSGIGFEMEKAIPVQYKDVTLDCGFRADFMVEGSVVVELKAVENLLPIHEAQVLTYLKITGLKIGLIINFNVRVLKHGIRRFIL